MQPARRKHLVQFAVQPGTLTKHHCLEKALILGASGYEIVRQQSADVTTKTADQRFVRGGIAVKPPHRFPMRAVKARDDPVAVEVVATVEAARIA